MKKKLQQSTATLCLLQSKAKRKYQNSTQLLHCPCCKAKQNENIKTALNCYIVLVAKQSKTKLSKQEAGPPKRLPFTV